MVTGAGLLLRDTEVAELLGVAVQTLRGWRCNGKVNVPFVRLGRTVRYPVADVLAYVKRQMVTGQPEILAGGVR